MADKTYWLDVAERMIKTGCQALAGVLAGSTLVDMDWRGALAIVGTAVLGSLLTSLASLPVGEAGSASALHVPRVSHDQVIDVIERAARTVQTQTTAGVTAKLDTSQAVGDRGRVVQADAAATGLDDSSADAVVGEAMLTMQSDRAKAQIVAEAHRVLRPGGRYAIHELALNPDTLSDDQKTEIRKSLARSIKVNARPLTEQEWRKLFTDNGFTVEKVAFAPMALLEPRRVIADEGVLRTLRFVGNVIRNPKARKRILGMRATFTKYRDNLAAIEIVAAKDGV